MSKSRLLVTNIVGIIVILLLVGFGGYYFYEKANYVKTDEAQVEAPLSQVIASANGQLSEWNAKEGDSVSQGDSVGSLKEGDKSADVTSMIDGTIIKNNASQNQLVKAGDVLAQTADLSKIYITANIKETDLGDIEEGDSVDITVDGDSGKVFKGHVEAIGRATNSVSSMLPAQNTGNYTKVTQKVPVKISIDDASDKVLPGMNAEVKISI
ncbi:HlyD family efflux transporter periplasmic adaptor subunit [Priestia megaterium]|uniref:efflux RND transporter periplasmic adaptor subunit n=1 Tax=Priestia megaterium TaxID=1404 RepID=UPI0026E47471|nr:HlyD family efflux transporter periplasmic adaptor subunit [Priestia megaterium]MDO6848804.1 HlyD family efflux transporter periplasmic adaptor subunit [Priestia megaterium]